MCVSSSRVTSSISGVSRECLFVWTEEACSAAHVVPDCFCVLEFECPVPCKPFKPLQTGGETLQWVS
ncbi:hypothetical protein G5714_017331 [Onychostoma macrolepis]|uniref:Uncharacterized protein n=1 Tax=Onychostoma macrolepis TaxID=369639 RepID=A0A7J6C650_9TELE|nr:hypothetical protein G5714_017331 [Onychostoma macrolepis]